MIMFWAADNGADCESRVFSPDKVGYDIAADIIETRLSSNLRPTTRECVYLVTRGHFRSQRWWSHPKTPYANFMAVAYVL